MMQRLFELEPRAASMTVSDPSARASTQASNFSLRMRSAAPVLMGIASIPNCLKHSASSTREGSLNPTNAALAAAFRVTRKGARVVSKALSIRSGKTPLSKLIVRPTGWLQKVPKDQPERRRRAIARCGGAGERTLRPGSDRGMRKFEADGRKKFPGRGYSLQRRNSRAPLVPPKPKEFDMAYSIAALRAL